MLASCTVVTGSKSTSHDSRTCNMLQIIAVNFILGETYHIK